MKSIFKFSIDKEELKEVRTKNDDGTITLSNERTVQSKEVILGKPSRRDKEEMSMVYHAKFNKCLAAGIGTQEMIRKSILDNGGGGYSKVDLERLDKILKEHAELTTEYEAKKLSGEDTQEVQEKLTDIIMEVGRLENIYEKIFEHSAEYNAMSEVVLWAVMNLTKYSDGASVFTGPTFESKVQNYYDIEDASPDSVDVKIYNSATVIYYYYLIKLVTEEDKLQEIYDITKK